MEQKVVAEKLFKGKKDSYQHSVKDHFVDSRLGMSSYFSQHSTVQRFDPRHDKTNNVAVHPAKTQISLGICQVWSESSLCAWRTLEFLNTHWAHSKDSDQPRHQADLSLRLAYTHFVSFVMSRLILCTKIFVFMPPFLGLHLHTAGIIRDRIVNFYIYI